MTKLEIAAIYAGLNLLLLTGLGLWVGEYRRRSTILAGDGGDAQLARLIRMFGNSAEYIPAGAIGLMFLALLDPAPAWLVQACGLAFTSGRALTAWGLFQARQPNPARMGGAVLTLTALATCGAGVIWAALAPSF